MNAATGVVVVATGLVLVGNHSDAASEPDSRQGVTVEAVSLPAGSEGSLGRGPLVEQHSPADQLAVRAPGRARPGPAVDRTENQRSNLSDQRRVADALVAGAVAEAAAILQALAGRHSDAPVYRNAAAILSRLVSAPGRGDLTHSPPKLRSRSP